MSTPDDINGRLAALQADYDRIQRKLQPGIDFMTKVCLLVGETDDLDAAWTKLDALVRRSVEILDGRIDKNQKVIDELAALMSEQAETTHLPALTRAGAKQEN